MRSARRLLHVSCLHVFHVFTFCRQISRLNHWLTRRWTRFDTTSAPAPIASAVLDETVLTDGAITSLADDPEYQEAMATAEAIGAGAEVVSNLVQRLVSQWLRRLI